MSDKPREGPNGCGGPALTREQRDQAQQLRAVLERADDVELDRFLAGYSLGHIGALIVSYMSPEQRVGFVAHLRATYPEAFARGSA